MQKAERDPEVRILPRAPHNLPSPRRTSWDGNGGQRPRLEISGRTEDGVLVVRNTFHLVNSVGLPLETVVGEFHQRGYMLDWVDFYIESLKCDWPPERTFERLRQVVGEEYGPKFREGWEVKMREVMRICREQGIGG